MPLRLLPALGSTSSGGGQLVRSADGGLTGTGVASYELAPTSRLLVVRLAGDGTPVATFGTGGVTVIGTVVPVGPRGVDAVPGGGAVVAGFSASGLALLRIGATGLLESDARDTAGGTFQRGLSRCSSASCRAAGSSPRPGSSGTPWIARLDALGRPVRSFGLPLLPGGVVVDAPPDARVEEITPRADGTLLVVGRTDTVGFVQRRRANGSSDPSWGGGDGRVELPTGTAVARALLLADGSVLLGGSRFVGVERVMMIARLTPGGALDPLFGGGDGIADVPYPTGAFSAGLPPGVRALTLAPDGSIVFVDTAERLTGGFLTVIGRLTASGAPDASFGAGGLRTAPLASASVYSAVRDAAGRLVVGGMAGDDGLVLRLRSDGSADPTFGTNGVTIIPAASGAVRVTGIGSYPDGSSVLHLLVLPNGSGLGLFRLVQLDRRGRNVAQRLTLLDAVADPVVLPDGRLLIGDDHRVSTGSEGRIARVLGPPPPRPLSVRRAGRVARGFVLSARVDARGLTGVSLQVEVRRNGRFAGRSPRARADGRPPSASPCARAAPRRAPLHRPPRARQRERTDRHDHAHGPHAGLNPAVRGGRREPHGPGAARKRQQWWRGYSREPPLRPGHRR